MGLPRGVLLLNKISAASHDALIRVDLIVPEKRAASEGEQRQRNMLTAYDKKPAASQKIKGEAFPANNQTAAASLNPLWRAAGSPARLNRRLWTAGWARAQILCRKPAASQRITGEEPSANILTDAASLIPLWRAAGSTARLNRRLWTAAWARAQILCREPAASQRITGEEPSANTKKHRNP